MLEPTDLFLLPYKYILTVWISSCYGRVGMALELCVFAGKAPSSFWISSLFLLELLL